MPVSDDSQQPQDVLVVARALEGAMKELSGEFQKINDYAKKSRQMIWIATTGLIFDIVLSFVVGFIALQSDRASDRATRASEEASQATSTASESIRTQRITCEAGNTARKLQRELSAYFFQQAEKNDPNMTAAQQRLNRDFLDYVNKTYADRNCEDLDDVPSRDLKIPDLKKR